MFVLFLDLAGFTAYSEERGGSEAARLARVFALRAMHGGRRYGLRPVKTVGDAVIFLTEEPSSAAEGAMALVAAFETPDSPLRAHAALACGEVVEDHDDVFGRCVNLAARLAAEAAPGQILVDRETAARLDRGSVRVLRTGKKKIKGFAKAVELFQVGRRLGSVEAGA